MSNNNNVTFRRKNLNRSLSMESLDSLASCRSVKSMLDLSTHLKSEEYNELQNMIINLKEQLLSAHLEIEALNEENNSLKQKLNEEKQKTSQFKNMYISSISSSRNPCSLTCSAKGNRHLINRANVSSRKLDLSLDFQTPKVFKHPCIENNIEKPNIEDKQLKITSESQPFNDLKTTQINTECETAKHNTSISQPKPETGNIILLSDNQGEGIVDLLIRNKSKLILKDYKISGIRKPDAPTEEVLSSCNLLAKELTANDSVVIMTGSNDSNPFKFLMEMSLALKALNKCHVYVVNVLYNAFLNEGKLNYNLKLLAQNFNNFSFIEAKNNFSIVKQIIHKINIDQYNKSFLSFNKKPTKVAPIVKKSYTVKDTPYFFQKSRNINQKTQCTQQPRRGTIPYYFQVIDKTNKPPSHVPDIDSGKNNLFRD